jgi:ArsR family transcriptional regulator
MNMTAALPIFDQMSALSDATRCRVLLLLERQELTVSELCAVMQQPQSTVSRHLRVLSDEAWVVSRADGTSRRYSLVGERLDSAARRLWSVVRESVAASSASGHDTHRLQSVLARRRSRSQEFFTASAAEWDRVRGELFGHRSDVLALLSLLDADWVMGDLGCGTGHAAEALAPAVKRVIAVDESAAMLAAAKRRLTKVSNIEFRRGALEALPLAASELDAAVCVLALHYVADPEAAINEMHRVTRTGGRLVIVDMLPHDRAEYQREMGHVWRGFSADAVTTWMAHSGFDAVRIAPLVPDPAAKGPTLFAASGTRRVRRADTQRQPVVKSG